MAGLIWRLIVGRFHLHVWATQESRQLLDRDYYLIGKTIYLCCKTCGDWQRRRLA